MFGPLSFDQISLKDKPFKREETKCLLCECVFILKDELQIFLSHVFDIHNLVIEDVQNIDYLTKYVSYWRDRLKTNVPESIIPSLSIDGSDKKYLVLSVLLKEDKELRHRLKLEAVLEQQELERTDSSFKRPCLFCRLYFEGTQSDYVKHVEQQHNLQLGKPTNLVYISELLDVIEEKLNSLQCIYCEKTFPERPVLKEHMRKKLHKRINPSNHLYDKFYVVNYLEPGKNWQNLQKENDKDPINLDCNSDQEWSDWTEADQEIVCLFCDHSECDIDAVFQHMKTMHDFDFISEIEGLDFYQKVKMVNYIRRQVYIKRCVSCDREFENKNELLRHMNSAKHYNSFEKKIFDQPEYYFPTYENDTFLIYLENIND